MRGLVRFAVDHPVTVSMATVAAVVFGFVALARLDVRLLPEVRYPSLTLQTDFPNTAPLDVENLVTRPIEEAVGVVPGIRRVHSISQPGLSQVTMEFDWDTDMDYGALEVREKIDLISMPEDAEPPVLLRYDPALDPVVRVGLSGTAPLVAIRTVAEEVLKKEIESLRGVAAAKVSGGLEEEIRVEVDEAKLAALGIPIADVERALEQENVNASGGRLRDRDAEYLVRTLSRFEDLDGILDVTIALRDGHPVRLGEVAQVHRGHSERTTITHVDGRESVEIAVHKEGDANVVDVARRVRRHLDGIKEDLPAGVDVEVLFDQSVFIRQAIDEVRNNAIAGGFLSILVLFAFLRDLRSIVVIGLSIPLAIISTFVLMYAQNVSLNVMSLGGLALGVGMLVDNSIVVLESIARRREKAAGAETAHESVIQGTGEVAGAVTGSTLTTVAVFVPVVFVVEGITGQIFGDQALTITYSLLVSLLVAITFAPMIAALGAGRARGAGEPAKGPRGWRELRGEGRARHARTVPAFLFVGLPVMTFAGATRLAGRLRDAGRRASGPLDGVVRAMDRLARAYRVWLVAALRRPRTVLIGVAALVLVAAAFLGSLGTELIPPLSQGQVTLAVELPEGTPLARTDAIVAKLGREIRGIDGIETVSASVGVSDEGAGTAARRKENRADLYLQLGGASKELEARVLEQVRAKCEAVPDLAFKVRRPSLLTLNTPVEIDVYGYDVNALAKTGDAVVEMLGQVDGVRDVRTSAVPGSPEIRVTFDRDKLNRLGLTLSEVGATVQSKVRGAVASQFRDQERHIDIRVQNAPDQRSTLGAIQDLIVAEREGVPIRLASIASFEIVQSPAEIHRLGRQRVAIVTANLAGRDLGSASAEIAERLRGIPLPAGATVELGGQNEEMRRSFTSLRTAALLAIFLVYLVMAVQFESFLYPFLIMFTVPLALLGAVVGLGVTRTPISILAAIGGIMLAGIVVNNGIVLVDRINQLRRRHQDLESAILEASRERLRPILMTTGTTVLGLLPMALGLGEGAELRAPLAVTVVWGLSLATLLTLFVVPVLYLLFTPGERRPQEAPGMESAREPAGPLAPEASGGGG